ncbi:hypothetical protein ANTPLA_LOCUS8313 [Anthophora plagiata]
MRISRIFCVNLNRTIRSARREEFLERSIQSCKSVIRQWCVRRDSGRRDHLEVGSGFFHVEGADEPAFQKVGRNW